MATRRRKTPEMVEVRKPAPERTSAPTAERVEPPRAPNGAGVTLAYLVNQYPKVSHSFVRREILGLEAAGFTVERLSVRPCPDDVVDPEDQAEQGKTRVLLAGGAVAKASRLLGGLLRATATRPVRFFRALGAAWRIGKGSDRGRLFHLIYLAEACVLQKWFADARVQHVHAHFGTNSTTVALLVKTLGGPPFSFTVHGPEEFDKPLGIGLGAKIQAAEFVVAISSFCRSQLYRWAPHADWSKVEIVRCGVDAAFSKVDPLPVPDVPRLVCVGRLCEQKGQLLLVESAARLAKRLAPAKRSFELVLVGDGEMREVVTAKIREHGLDDQIRITGWMGAAGVRQELEAARALVLPSFAEGLPVVIMEALALGRPVVTTRIAGIPELVIDGEAGWVVTAGDVEALVEAMHDVLDADSSTLGKMGAAGRERVLVQHDATSEAWRLGQRILDGAARRASLSAPR